MSVIQWLYVAIVAPLLGWLGGWFHSWRRGKRRKKAILAELSGLPPEAKSVLVDFYHQGTHTLRGDPFAPIVKLLVSRGHIAVGPGAGSYDAVNRYLSITPHIWEVMPDWVFVDPVAVQFLGELLEKTDHDDPPNP